MAKKERATTFTRFAVGQRVLYRLLFKHYVISSFVLVFLALVGFLFIKTLSNRVVLVPQPTKVSSSTSPRVPSPAILRLTRKLDEASDLIKEMSLKGNQVASKVLRWKDQYEVGVGVSSTPMASWHPTRLDLSDNVVVFNPNVFNWKAETTATHLVAIFTLIDSHNRGDTSCFEPQRDIHRNQADFWEALYPEGKQIIDDDFDFEFNHLVKARKSGLLDEEVLLKFCTHEVPRPGN